MSELLVRLFITGSCHFRVSNTFDVELALLAPSIRTPCATMCGAQIASLDEMISSDTLYCKISVQSIILATDSYSKP